MKHSRTDRLLDLGWYPDGNLEEGGFGLVVMQGDFRGEELFRLRTTSRLEVVAEIERLLDTIERGEL